MLASIDRAILLSAAPSEGLLPLVEAVTWLGDSLTRTIIAAFVAVGLLAVRAWRRAAVFVAIVAGGAGANSAMKAIVHRPRPALLPHLDAVTSFSFPSGHAANGAILYLSIALLMPARHRAAALALAMLLVVAIGTSRVVLAVHWPSDVLAGWLFGLGWIMLWNQGRPGRAAG
ncbi:phosphatase PAP2 family protein [Sphingomonas solaris]|uniref:phosphatase PAP2 family protein n=1 Tax=Alterirhizorhabdus solaris TaxID=2529389 RepID=UPI001EEFEDE7|nr:phosphatase PAP2 family protein [Sphingomonas solaris]